VEGVTKAFMEAMRAAERQVSARVVIDFTDPTLDQSLNAETSEAGRISYPAQTADAVETVPHKWASLDGSWVLDGTYHLMPDTPEDANRYQVGWWGLTLAGADGAFAAPYPALTVTFLPRPVHSLKVVGDSARAEYPVDFAIRLYDEADTLLHEELVTGNAGVTWGIPLEASVNSVTRMVLEITRWSHAGRQVKVTEFFTSVQQTYAASDLLEISLLEEREVSQGSLPVGTISANEVTIKLDNGDRCFDADNEQSPLYQLLKPNRRIRAWMGVDGGDPAGQEVSKLWDTQADWLACSLPPQVEATIDGDLRLYRPAVSFSRNSLAYLPDGTQIAIAVARYWWGRWQNQLSANQSTMDGGLVDGRVSGWGVNTGCAISSFTEADGNKCLRVVTAGGAAQEGVLNADPLFYGTPGRRYILSIEVWGEGTVRVRAGSQFGGAASAPVNLTGGKQRIFVATTVPANPNQPSYMVVETYRQDNAPQAVTFYMDNAQIAEAVEGQTTPTDWRPGGVKGAVMVEEGTTNIAENALFANPSGGVPQNYAPFVNDGTGAHATANGEYQATLSTAANGQARVGIYGAWRPVAAGDVVSAQVKARVANGTCVARLRVQIADATQANILATYEAMATLTDNTVLKIENKSAVGQAYVRILTDAFANGNAANLGAVAFSKPQIEKKAYCTSWQPDGVTRSAEAVSLSKKAINPARGTVRFWFEPLTSPTTWGRLLHLGAYSSPRITDELGIYYGTGWGWNRVQIAIGSTAGVYNTASATMPGIFVVGRRYYCCIRWELPGHIQITLFDPSSGVSGTAYSSPVLPTTAAPTFDAYSTAFLGCYNAAGGDLSNVIIDDFLAEDVEWNDAQVVADYQRTSPAVPTEHTIALLPFDGSLTSDYPSQATVVTEPVDLTPVGAAATSVVTWAADAPAGTTVAIEASVDGGQTWEVCPVDEGGIPVIHVGEEMTGKSLLIRAVLAADDPAATPVLHSLAARVLPNEWVAMGTFWSTEWQAHDDTVEAQVIARDRLEPLRKTTYQSSVVVANATLYDLAVAVFQDAGLEAGEYYVDLALQAITVPYAWFEPVSHREALRLIAEAAFAQVYCDRDGVIRVDGPGAGFGASIALEITADDYVRLNNPMRPDQVANEILVDTQPLKPAAAPEEVYRSNEPITVPPGQSLVVTVHYSKTPVIDGVASLEGAGVAIDAATYYGWGAEITLSNAGGVPVDVTLVVTGRPLSVQSKERAAARATSSITENGVLRYKFPDNPLVQALAVAQQIADQILASAKDPRRDLSIDWRGNPALELGDRATVKARDYHVIRQQIDWAGALSATTTGRRAT